VTSPRTLSSARRRKTLVRPALSGRALALGKRRIPLLSGAVHYWRLAREAWRPALEEIRNLGLPIVETYVPWGVHERPDGSFDFGEHDPKLDVGAFLDLAHELGLAAFVRPGPHINAEMTYFGLPERIVYDPECQARSPRGNPVILPWPPRAFPIPSYASRAYFRETGRWYDAVAEALQGRIYPDGPIAIIQVDNEATYYFRNGPYDQDYHPDAVALYRGYLEKRYHGLDHLNRAYRRSYERWEDIEPPKRFSDESREELLVQLDWAGFQEHLITRAVGKMRRRLSRTAFRGLPTVHNLPLGDGGLPVDMPALAKTVDLVGLDFYHSARELRTIKRRTLYLSGTFDLPYAPELGVGAPPWFTPLHHEDSFFCTLSCLAYGLRGFNLYMAVDRDRWYGAPIDSSGHPRLEAASWKTLVTRLKDLSFHELERKADVALVVPNEYRRLTRATHLLGGILSPSALEAMGGTPVDACREDALGFKGPIQVLWWRMLAKVGDALTRARIPYVFIDSEVEAERLERYRVVVAPAFEFASVERWKRLCSAARHGVHVVYGPAMPELDERMRSQLFEVPYDGRRVGIDTPEDADEVVREIARTCDLARPFRVEPEPLESTVHEDTLGPRVVFVINPDRPARTATLELPFELTLADVLTGERFKGTTRIELPVAGLTCRMLAIEPERAESRREARPPSARRKAS
jgi:beta-galactosidase